MTTKKIVKSQHPKAYEINKALSDLRNEIESLYIRSKKESNDVRICLIPELAFD